MFNFFYQFFYQRFKVWFWLLLALLFATGAVTKLYKGSPLVQVIINVVLMLFSLIVFIRLLRPQKSVQSQEAEIKVGRLVVLFTALGAFAAIAILPYQEQLGLMQPLTDRYSIPQSAAMVLSVVQTTILSLITGYIGLLLCGKVRLGAPLLGNWLYRGVVPKFSGRWIGVAVLGSLLGTLIVALLEIHIFQPRLPALDSNIHVDIWKAALTLFYGGIVEEILLRLFLMTLIVWILTIPLRRKQKKEIPGYFYWIAIVLAALIFGLAHLPAAVDLFGGLSGVLLVKTLVLNGLLGIFFGYLYWKKGLEYAIIAHMCADLFLHVVWSNILG